MPVKWWFSSYDQFRRWQTLEEGHYNKPDLTKVQLLPSWRKKSRYVLGWTYRVNVIHLQELRGENARLKSEVSSIKWVKRTVAWPLCVCGGWSHKICQPSTSATYCRCLYDQLVHETPHEQFSEKRVQLLKSQLHLLERQVYIPSVSTILFVCVCVCVYFTDGSSKPSTAIKSTGAHWYGSTLGLHTGRQL